MAHFTPPPDVHNVQQLSSELQSTWLSENITNAIYSKYNLNKAVLN